MPSLSDWFFTIISLYVSVWWIVTPLILFFIFADFWLAYVRKKFLMAIEWKLLEVRVPRNILKTPKAMEQIFSGLHSVLRSKIKFYDKYFDGVIQEWFSLEIVGLKGNVYFFIKTPALFRNLVEAQIYAQYPDAEIKETDDFFDFLPASLPNKEFDIWGTEIILAREDAYPIRTYPYFEESQEEKRLDSITVIAETMAKLDKDEIIWLQFLIRPVGDDWKKKAQELIDKLLGRGGSKKKSGWGTAVVEFIRNFIWAPFEHPVWADAKPSTEKSPNSVLSQLTSGEKDAITAMEEKIAKIGFEGGIRFLYCDKASAFTRSNIVTIMGVFRQFNTQNLNAFKPNSDAGVSPSFLGWFMKKRREYMMKKEFFSRCKKRKFLVKSSVFNVEELATIFHFPTLMVEAPTLRRVESRKGEPPPSLPIG